MSKTLVKINRMINSIILGDIIQELKQSRSNFEKLNYKEKDYENCPDILGYWEFLLKHTYY